MNKTVTINISGIIFHIEEDAYESLSKYLATIKGYFSKTDGGNEIMSDIEARIAELLQSKINASKQVILMMDVNYVMDVMGKPEEFNDESANTSPNEGAEDEDASNTREKSKRKLFRNPDEKAIGGVCSGLAAYFDIDTVWVRLAMFLLIFFGGVSLWVYIILWIVMPEAKTTADKLAMRGESANVNSIFQSFKEEATDVKNRMSKQANDFKNSNYGEAVRSNAATVLSAFFNVLGRLFGFFLISIGAVLLIGYLTSVLGISILDSNNDLIHWRRVIFESSKDYVLGVFAFIIVIGIPILLLMFAGVKLLFKIRYNNRWLNISLGVLWTIGIILGFYVAVSTIKQFNESSSIKETVLLHQTGDTIVVKMAEGVNTVRALNFENADDVEHYISKNKGGYFFGEHDHNLSVIGYAGLNVVESTNDSVELIVTRTARGESKKDANDNARAIDYMYHQNNGELVFDEIFSVMEGSKFRGQELDIKLKLPIGKVIYFDKSVKNLLDDIDNTTNNWDGDMILRRWKMTERGLQCIDCENLESVSGRRSNRTPHKKIKTEHIIINGEGIDVNGEGTEIKIDENGIRIRTQDDKVEVKNPRKKK